MDWIYNSLKLLLTPEIWLFLLFGIGSIIAWTRSWHRSARYLFFLLFAVYYVLTTRPLAQLLAEPLETYYQPPKTATAPYDALVMVMSALVVQPFNQRPTIVGTSNSALLLCGMSYVRAGSSSQVILVRGPLEGGFSRQEHVVLQEWATWLGYPPDTRVIEAKTSATSHRAQAVKEFLGDGRSILLFDAAMHLPRSTAAFRKAGFIVTPVPCDYEISMEGWQLLDFVPQLKNFMVSSTALHEYVGLLSYRIRQLI